MKRHGKEIASSVLLTILLVGLAGTLAAQTTVPTGTAIVVTLNQTVSSKDAKAGESVSGVVSDDVTINGKTVIPRNSNVSLTVATVQASGGHLLQSQGERYPDRRVVGIGHGVQKLQPALAIQRQVVRHGGGRACQIGARLGKRFSAIPAAVAEVLRRYPFPGNVRELKNVIERAAILSPGGELTLAVLPPRLLEAPPVAPRMGDGSDKTLRVDFRPGADTLESLERRLLEEALRAAGGKKQRAAELLGISRFALMRRVEKYGL